MSVGRRRLMAGIAAMPLLSAIAHAGESACDTDSKLNDWPDLGRYAAANQQLIAANAKIDIVFMGDSITQGWPDKSPHFFSPTRVCRGIGGQTTPQMLLRMMADVVALKPKLVHIMGGTNDIAGNTGLISPAQTIDNISAMALLAKVHGIRVLIGSIPPAASFPWRPGLETRRAIETLNNALRGRADRLGSRFVDYTPALGDGAGGMKAGLSYDGVHPDTKGYHAMEKVLARLI